MNLLRTSFFSLCVLLFVGQSSWGQSHLYFATAAETFWDSSAKIKVRKLTKGECVLIENTDLYKKKFLYATSVKDGKAGFIDKDHVKFEKTYFPDSVGNHPLEFARKEYQIPFVRLINASRNAKIKIIMGTVTYELKPGEKREFHTKAGTQRFKVLAPGFQPLYTQETFQSNHISELEFYLD